MVALADDVDYDRVSTYLERGDRERLQAVLERVRDTIGSEEFVDAYKGIFTVQDLPADRIETVQRYLTRQIEDRTTS